MSKEVRLVFYPTPKSLGKIAKKYEVFNGTNAGLRKYLADELERHYFKVIKDNITGEYSFTHEKKSVRGKIKHNFRLGEVPIIVEIDEDTAGCDEVTFFKKLLPPKLRKYIITEREARLKNYRKWGLVKY